MGFFSSSRSHPLYLPVPLTLLFLSSVWFSPRAVAQWNPLNPVQSTRKNADGLTVFLESGALRLQICTDSIVRVLYSPQRDFPAVAEYVVSKTDWPKANFDVAENEKEITLTAAKLKVVVTKKDSSIVFYDAAGKKLAAENDRTMTPVEVNGEKTYHLERFTNMWDTQEAFYGLGQHQGGVFNWRGESVDVSRTTPISPSRCSSPATATEFSGTIRRAAASTTASSTRSTSAPKSPTDRLLLYLWSRSRPAHRRLSRTNRSRAHFWQMGLWLLAMQEPL